MCRAVAYLGEPLPLEPVLFDGDSSLAKQTYSPRMMRTFLNLAGFGIAAWQPSWSAARDPLVYRSLKLPDYDQNLRRLTAKLEPTCAIAHVRGVTESGTESVDESNLHPFWHPDTSVVMAHNGHLREFARMRYDLLPHLREDLARTIRSTTDSEWLYLLTLSQLADPLARPGARELGDAVLRALRIVREVRGRAGIDTSSPVNLFFATGDAVVVTRFSFDYGWYPSGDALLETDLPFCSLWCSFGESPERAGGAPSAAVVPGLLVASEPLSLDARGWLELPEYSMICAERTGRGVEVETRDIDA